MTIGAVMPTRAQEQPEHIECRDCGQLLALRWASGRMKIVVVDQQVEAGRIEVVCPRCQRRIRIRMTKAA